MKELHLLCNAHLDPVWMWDWDEGAAEALATYYSAVELLDEYDFVFCHNEVLLYEFVREYDGALFERIKQKIESGKWRIMGGWYLQPDCHAPSGESITRQIYLGKKYFLEQFGKSTRVALNFDSFGHSRGLVQILTKNGYDAYMFCRPLPEEVTLKDNLFYWEGYDGSKIKAMRLAGEGYYSSPLGQARENIEKRPIDEGADVWMVPWGVGNHGGGPSRKDLEDIAAMQQEADYSIIHSYPEAFFDKVTPRTTLACQLDHSFAKCYTSMNRIKAKHTELEHALFLTEKMASVAAFEKGMVYPTERFDEAMKDMAFIEFHDILSGTCGPDGEKSALQKADHALKILNDIKLKAFFALAEDFKQTKEGMYSIFVFNPCQTERKTTLEAEFLILNCLCSDVEEYKLTAYQNGKVVPLQVVKQLSNINYDRRKRIVLDVTMPPMQMSRFDIELSIVPKKKLEQKQGVIVFEDKYKKVTFDMTKGLITRYEVNGKTLAEGDVFVPYLFDDDPDSWGLGQIVVGRNDRRMPLSVCDKDGVFSGLQSVKITEDGEVYTQIESCFEAENISVFLTHKIYKDQPYVDVTAKVFYQSFLKGLRFAIPATGAADVQTMFGREPLPRTREEKPMQRFLHFANGFTVLNDNTYGVSADEKQAYLQALNGACYCSHYLGGRDFIDYSRYVGSMESGTHVFNYRLGAFAYGEEETAATEFVEKPYAICFFPHGKGEKTVATWNLPQSVTLVSMRQMMGGYVLRLFNNTDETVRVEATLFGKPVTLSFGKFEAKTLLFKDGEFIQLDEMI